MKFTCDLRHNTAYLRLREKTGAVETIRLLLSLLMLSFPLLSGCAIFHDDIQSSSQAKVTEATISEVCKAIEMFEIDMGYIPTSGEGLKVLVENPSGGNWHGPYIKGNCPPLDAWGTPLRYAAPANRSSYTVISAGPDKRFETKDDITRKQQF